MTSAVPYAEVIGDPIGHSKSPLIHRFWLDKLRIEGDYRATRVGKDDLAAYLHHRRHDPLWRGCNVTMPLKQAALAHVEHRSDEVAWTGAANCLIRHESGALHGANYDVEGVARPLRAMAKPDYSGHVATCIDIIGSGGAAWAAGLGSVRAGFGDFEIYTRNRATGLALAAQLGTPFGEVYNLDALGPWSPLSGSTPEKAPSYTNVIINATPLGMRGQPELPVDLAGFHANTVVFDMIYDPIETALLRQARGFGMRVIDGLTMLIEQASCGFEAFFGASAPRQHDDELRRLLTQ